MSRRSLHQSFLSSGGDSRALVWKYSSEYRRPRHFHDEPELNLIVAGSATFGVGRALVQVGPGELLGFPAGQDHALLHASADLRLFAIGMAPELSALVLGEARHEAAMPLHAVLAPHNFKSLVERASSVVDRSGVDPQIAELWQQANWFRRGPQRGLRTEMHVLTRRALAMLAEEPALDRALLARRVRAAPTEVSRYFHRDLGLTLTQYRTRLRVLRLIRLVDQRACSLTSAADIAGFGSYSQCHRAFRAELGCTLRDFFGSDLRQRMQLQYLPAAPT
jgi:AraC-like DNA-binding protein